MGKDKALFIRANGVATAYPTADKFDINEIEEPMGFFAEKLDDSLSVFSQIACDVTDNCNLRCKFCINDFSDASATHMSPQTFEKVISMAPLCTDGGGFLLSCLCEPLLHPDLIGLLKMIPEELRNKFAFTTNLSTKKLNDDFFSDLAKTAVHHISVSVDSLNKTVFERMRVNAKHEVFMHNLEKISRAMPSNPTTPDLHFITLATKSNLDEIPDLVRQGFDQYNVAFYEIRYPFEDATPDGDWKNENFLSAEQWERLMANMTSMPYKTHLTKGAQLTLCGFGQQDTQAWGPDRV